MWKSTEHWHPYSIKKWDCGLATPDNLKYNSSNCTKKVSEKKLHFLHPSAKPSEFTRGFGCRKCSFFSETFFRSSISDDEYNLPHLDLYFHQENASSIRDTQPYRTILRSSRFGRCKTSDFFEQKYGCFASKVRMFASKKSDVFDFRKWTVSKGYRPEDFYRFTSSATDGRSAESVTLQPSQSMPGMGGTSLRTLTLAARTTGKATRMPWSRRPQRCSSN